MLWIVSSGLHDRATMDAVVLINVWGVMSPDSAYHTAYHTLTRPEKRQRLQELATVFLRLGAIAIGGPAAHIALMEEEIVQRRQWMSSQRFLDRLGMTNLIPGPNSTELAIQIGYDRAGWRGLLVAGIGFILPAMLMVWAIAVLYQRYQTLPQLGWLLYGMKPVVVAIVLQAVWTLGKKALKDRPTIAAGGAALVGYLLGWNEIGLLVSFGGAVMLAKQNRSAMGAIVSVAASASSSLPVSLHAGSVFLFFLKIGCVLYGSGYVLLAFLQRELVEQQQWLTAQQLLDAIAIAQMTPGPVSTTATFLGYLLAGHIGAIAATVGIFLPAFGFVALVNPWVPKLRNSQWASGFLDGVNAVSLGLMAGVTVTLAQAAIVDWETGLMALGSAIALVMWRINSGWLLVAGAAIGVFVQWSGGRMLS